MKINPVYVLVVLMVGTVAGKYMNALDAESFKTIMGVLGPLALAALGFKQDKIAATAEQTATEVREVKSRMLMPPEKKE